MYDIIGDIHGHADELKQLLQKMGYANSGGSYVHPDNRQIIFVGDLIDRGPKVRETLQIAKEMCDAGHAKAVMGNHEYNALCFHTADPESGGHFREHTPKNTDQHIETLNAFRNRDSEWADYLEWFKSLPLYLDLNDIRVVHACWDTRHIEWIRENYHGISTSFLQSAAGEDKDQRVYKVIEQTLKGKEYPLPEGMTFKDKGGKVRHQCRVRWWKKKEYRETYEDVLIECPDKLASKRLNSQESFHYYAEDKPVFFGHYWLQGKPRREHPRAICLDYSVAQDGKLVAYRWNGNKNSGNGFIY